MRMMIMKTSTMTVLVNVDDVYGDDDNDEPE